MEIFAQKIIEAADAHGISVNQEQALMMAKYAIGLLEANKTTNMTAITDCDAFIEKHIIDSLSLLSAIKNKEETILDVGTGGGFPGVPLAIMLPTSEVTLLDSTEKKIEIVRGLCEDCGISNLRFFSGRAEDLGKTAARETFEYVVSRAVASLRILAELCMPFVRRSGFFIALKGQNVEEEMEEGLRAVEILGGKLAKSEPFKLLQSDSVHVIITINKVKITPTKYPRNFGQIKKKPL